MSAHASPFYDDIERDLLGALGEAVIATDLDGSIIFWNEAAKALYGWTAAEVLGRSILDITPTPMSRDAAAAIFADLLEGKTWSGEFETRHKDGRQLRVEVTDYPVRNGTGQLVAIVGISRLSRSARRGNQKLAPAKFFGLFGPKAAAEGREWLIAGGIFAGAVGLRLLCDLIVPDRLPFVTYLPAVAIGALFLRPWMSAALIALFGATGLAWIRWHDVQDPFVKVTAPALFLISGGVLVVVLSYAAALHRQVREREDRLALLNGELNHRIKNLFALTTSVCLQTIRTSASLTHAADAIVGRIQAIAAAQELATAAGDGIDLCAMVERVVRPMCPAGDRLTIDGAKLDLSGTDATSFSLLLHELATNSIKYGAWSGQTGEVHVSWTEEANSLFFTWVESGAHIVDPGELHEGFGAVLIRRAFPSASIRHEITPGGAFCSVSLPR